MGRSRVQGQGAPQMNPEVAGARRAGASMRQINFAQLSKPLMDIGPGSPEKKAAITEIRVDTKYAIFDFCGAMGNILMNDLFFPSAATIVKLEGLQDVLGDMLKDTKDASNREVITKARRIMSNFIRGYRNLYFFEAKQQEMIIAMNNFFLDFSAKLSVDVSEFIRIAPKGVYGNSGTSSPAKRW